jgi:hypothetical protein
VTAEEARDLFLALDIEPEGAGPIFCHYLREMLADTFQEPEQRLRQLEVLDRVENLVLQKLFEDPMKVRIL